jgi:hypothetical protein
MRLCNRVAIALSCYSLLGSGSARADKGFADRCVALNARLAKLNCRDGLREVELLLADSSDIFSDFHSQLKTNRSDVVALASVMDRATELARDCLVKHVNERRPVDQAYIALSELQSDMGRWLSHKWEIPPNVQARFNHQLAEKQQKAMNALVAVEQTW